MADEAFEERELFLRCPSCEGGAPRPACEECGGLGFIAAGLTTGMLSRLMDQVQEMNRVVGSIHRCVRWGQERGRDDRGGDAG